MYTVKSLIKHILCRDICLVIESIQRVKPCTHGNDLHIRKFCMYANFAYVGKSIFALRSHVFLKSVESVKK